MKPIPTLYKGVQFRSRLEARWAVFFDCIESPWAYEMVVLESLNPRHIPDFFFPNNNVFAEVKPVHFNELTGFEIQKANAAAKESAGCILLCGGISTGPFWLIKRKNSVTSKDSEDEIYIGNESAVVAAISAKFDGFDDDRRTISKRYS